MLEFLEIAILYVSTMPMTIRNSAPQTECPACEGSANFLLSATDRNRKTTRESFDYYSCMECGLIFIDSPPDDMAPYYSGGYDPIPESLEALRLIASGEHFRSEPILKHRHEGKFLELGPWRGVLCSLMQDAGFEVTAIEMDGQCVEFLRNTVGVSAIQSCNPLQTMRAMSSGFDVIAAWHSMEHLPTPWLVIQEAARLLNPGGILLLAMPNPDSFEFSVLKSRWMHLDTPRHLYLFPIRSLINLCRARGLVPLSITTADEFSDIQSWHAWYSLARSVTNFRYVRGALVRLFYMLARRWQKEEGRGSAYCAVFARPSGAP